MVKVITWVDLEGRYRVTSPAYNDRTRPAGESDDAFCLRIMERLKEVYGLPANHTFHLVEDADQRARIEECGGLTFRYPCKCDAQGRRDASQGGAWEMDTDGRPKVNMAKARLIQMDRIREVRDKEIAKLDVPFMRAVETGDAAEQGRITAQKQTLRDLPQTFNLSNARNPRALKAAWPAELPSDER